MEDRQNYSRREMQGWGGMKHPIIRSEISFSNVEIKPGIQADFGKNVETLVDTLMVGLGMPPRGQVGPEEKDSLVINDMYEALDKAGLRYMSSLEGDQPAADSRQATSD